MGLVMLLAVLSLGSVAIAAPSGPTTAAAVGIGADLSPSIDTEITHLGDADPAVRRHAADSLVRVGAAARPAVLAASRGDDLQIADAAAQLLRSLPWWLAEDPPEVKQLLDSYGNAVVAERIGIVAQLGEKQGSHPALLRLLADEPNEDVCWQIEAQLIGQPDVRTLRAARGFDLQTSRPSALMLAAHAWLTMQAPAMGTSAAPVDRDTDRKKALDALERAVNLEAITPTYDDGQLDFAFDALAAGAVQRHQFDEAARLRREQCKRIGITRTSFPAPFFELLILHADFGPLAGFADDAQTYQKYLATPEALLILSRLYDRQGQSLLAKTLEQAALAASPAKSPSDQRRTDLVDFLVRHEWYDFATKECRATLSYADASPDQDDVNARLRLSSLAEMRGDEAQAADQLRMALDDHKSSGGDLTISNGLRTIRGSEAERVMQIELARYTLHVARAKNDSAEVQRQLDELLRLGPNDEEAALDLVPELKSRGRGAEAAKLFESVYLPLKTQIDGGNSDPSLLNEIAWLCARCGEHLDEALDLSNRAVAAEPDSAAYLDTNAEAHFREGQAAEAVRLETLALKYQPGDQFMERQLKRFQAGIESK